MPRQLPKKVPSYKKERAYVIGLRKDKGMSYRAIEKETGVCKTQVGIYIKEYEATGKLHNAASGPTVGSPYKVTPEIVGLVKRYMKGKERRGIRRCVKYLERKGISLSIHTVQVILKDKLKLHPYKKKKRPKTTPAHREHRIATAKAFQSAVTRRNKNPWINFAFSDECRFHTEPKVNRKNCVIWDDHPDDNKHFSEHSKYGGQSVEVWGAITRYGKPNLFFIERPMITVNSVRQRRKFKAEDYRDKILQKFIPKIKEIFNQNGIGDDDWTFQQDGDSKHRSKLVQSWCAGNITNWLEWDEWPANSPDLSIIENCWSVIWDDLNSRKPSKNREQLKRRIRRAWKDKITPGYIQKLYDSIPT